MTGELFNPEAFEQMPGQMSMEAVESTFALGIETILGVWRPPCGSAHCVWLERCAGRADCPCGMGDEPEARS